MNTLSDFFLRLGNTLYKNAFYVLWSMVIPWLVVFMSQGGEMLEHVLYDPGPQTGNPLFSLKGLNVSLVCLGFTLLGYAMWIVPTIAIQYCRKLFKTERSVYDMYRDLVNYYNDEGEYLPMRYFAVLPLVSLIIAIPISAYVYEEGVSRILGITLLVLGYFILFHYSFYALFQEVSQLFSRLVYHKFIRNLARGILNLRKNILSFFRRVGGKPPLEEVDPIYISPMAFNIVNTIFYILWFILMLIIGNFQNRWIISIFLSLFCSWHYMILFYLEQCLYNEQIPDKIKLHIMALKDKDHEKIQRNCDVRSSYWMTNFNYVVLIVLVLIFVILFFILSWKNSIGCVNPITILVIFFTFYLLIFDLAFKTPLSLIGIIKRPFSRRIKFLKLFFILLGWGYMYFFLIRDASPHRIRKSAVGVEDYYRPDQRDSLIGYFHKWRKERGMPDTVFLVAGQGGGSRAAAWIHLYLNALDEQGKLMDRIFAFSTASGSSVGVNMKLAEWKLQQLRKKEVSDSIKKSRIRQLYTTNYFSNSFYGILFGDFIEGFTNGDPSFDKDRNFRLQKEEFLGFKEVYKVHSCKDGEKECTVFEEHKEANIIHKHFEEDFLSFYKPLPKDSVCFKDLKYKSPPLFFINSTHVQRGERSVFSPVLTDFSFANDAYGYFKRSSDCLAIKNQHFNLPQVTAVCQSQSFPVISAFNYMEGYGNLADGGIVENSGCATLLEAYNDLKRDTSLRNVHFVVLIFQNSIGSRHYNSSNVKSALKGTFEAFMNGGLSGYSSFWRDKLTDAVGMYKEDQVYTLKIKHNITLARILNNRSIDSMIADIRTDSNLIQKIKNYYISKK